MATTSFRRSVVLFLALLFGVAIAVLSVAPINRVALGTRSGYRASAAAVHHAAVVHVTAHILIFAIAACVAWFAADFAASGVTGRAIAVVMTLLLGCTTEYLQHAMFRNPLELNDVFTNVVASACMFGLLALIASFRNRRPKPLIENTAFILRDVD